MLHLPIERLAELVDETAAPAERDHLAACTSCAAELQAHRRLVTMASDERRRIAPPLTEWGALSDALRAEGLIAPVPVARPTGRRFSPMHLLRRVAAVAVLVGGGAVLGRMTAGLGVIDAVAFRSPATTPTASPTADGDVGALLVSNDGDDFDSTQEAMAALERAQRAYEAAATYLANHDEGLTEQAPDRYRTRLAALDRTAETMVEALHEAPQDPLINQYLVATLGAREQTLRRLGTALPVGNRLVRR